MLYSDDRQYHIGVKEGEVGKYVILPGDPQRCAVIAKHLQSAVCMAQNREFVTYTGYLAGQLVSVTSTGIGGPSAAIALEELVRCGADTFIRVGTCGGMQQQVHSSDLIVATGAVRMEGTSAQYAPVEYPAVADLTVTNALIRACTEAGYPFHTGIVHSKDSFYGQHEPDIMPVNAMLKQKWQAWIRMGCLASEMEAAALFIVGAYLGVRVGCVLSVVANQIRQQQGLENPVNKDAGRAIEAALHAVRLLIGA